MDTELKDSSTQINAESILQWVIENRSKVLIGAGAVISTALVLSVIFLKNKQQEDMNWTQISRAQSLMSQSQSSQAREVLSQIKSAHPNDTVGLYSRFYLGEIALQEKKWDEAIDLFSIVQKNSGKLPLEPLALSNLAFAKEQKGDFSEAATLYKQFMEKHNDHFFAARNQLALGRCLMLAGQKDAAKQALGQLIDLYPTSEWAQNARRMLDKI